MNKKLVGTAVVGVAVAAIVTAQFVGGSDPAPAAAPPSTSPSAPPSTVEGRLQTYEFPDVAGGRGWSVQVPVPVGWAEEHDKDRATFRHDGLLLETDRVPIDQEDARSGLAAIAAKAHHDPAGIKPLTVGGLDAAEWDYTYLREGIPTRATVVGLGAADSLITIRYEAPPDRFDRDRGVLDAALHVEDAG